MPVVVRSPSLKFQVVVLFSLPAEVGIDTPGQLFDRAPLGDLDVHKGLRSQLVDQVELGECLSCFVFFSEESPQGIGDCHRSTVGHAPGREISPWICLGKIRNSGSGRLHYRRKFGLRL